MKPALYLLKALILLGVIVTCSSCNNDSKTKKEIETFFSEYLSGKEVRYNEESSIKLADIAKEQKLVWEAWKNANNNFSEEKLLETASIDQKNSGEWNLPEELEPNAIMHYYWGSKGEKPNDGFSLFLYMHGSGNKNREWANGLRFAQNFDDAPSIYFVPQIPNTGNYYRWYQQSKQYAWEKLLRLAFVTGDVNPNKVYFFGISEGGYGSQRLASFYADYLAGAGPMAAGEPLRNAPIENCRNIAFSLRTGAEDKGFERYLLTQYTKDEFEKFEMKYPGSFKHKIELIPDSGHRIDYSHTTPWLKQFTRNPYPKFVSWENFEMDNIYRKGFYNIVVDERSNDDPATRTYYELEIDGNNISLKAELVTYEVTEKDPRWGIEMKYEKNYVPATKGKITVYLCPELVNLDKEVTLTVNGKDAFIGIVKPQRKHIVNSCATFFDPARLYSAAIEIDLQKL